MGQYGCNGSWCGITLLFPLFFSYRFGAMNIQIDDMETAEMINDDVETAEMIKDYTEIKEMINDDVETKEIHSIQYNYCTLTAMLSRSAAERDIYLFVVQKILQNYNFSPGQELSHDYHQE